MRVQVLLLIGAAALAPAEDKQRVRAASTDLTVPALGFLAGPAAEPQLRPVLGVRAFPALGQPVALPADALRVLVAPGQDYALVETAEDWSILPLRDAAVRRATVLAGKAALAAVSPSGTAAAFYLQDSATVVVIGGLPSRPRVAFQSGTGGAITCLAVADSADLVAAGQQGSVLLLRPDQPPAAAVQAGAPAAIAFLRNSRRAIVADREWNQILSLQVSGTGTDAAVIASANDGLVSPAALAIDEAGGAVVVAGERSLLLLSLADGSARKIDCDFQPINIMPMAARLLAVRAPDDAGAWLLRLESAEPALLYAPALD